MSGQKHIKHTHEPLIRIAKRTQMPTWQMWLIRVGAIALGFLVAGVMSVLLTEMNFGEVYDAMFRGNFGNIFEGKTSLLWTFLQQTAILLCLSLAVTPAFKMRFWNCGAEGQALMGGLTAMICMVSLGGKMPDWCLIIVIVIVSTLSGAIWGAIPAVFRAAYKTNETLFTLMMNYVATQIVAYYVYLTGKGSGIIQPVAYGNLPEIKLDFLPKTGQRYLINIIIVIAIMVAMYIYLRFSKQGYEVSVVGESHNTAKYVGINVKKVIIRTMIISGAICGIAGMLLVAGKDHSINTNTVGGQGFTAIMISWLGQFNPFIMALMSALVIFLQTGAAKVADTAFLNSSYADIISGIVILFLVGCEFFIQYTIKFRHTKKEGE